MLHQVENTCTYSKASPSQSPLNPTHFSTCRHLLTESAFVLLPQSAFLQTGQDRRKVSNFLYLVSHFTCLPLYSVHISMCWRKNPSDLGAEVGSGKPSFRKTHSGGGKIFFQKYYFVLHRSWNWNPFERKGYQG